MNIFYTVLNIQNVVVLDQELLILRVCRMGLAFAKTIIMAKNVQVVS